MIRTGPWRYGPAYGRPCEGQPGERLPVVADLAAHYGVVRIYRVSPDIPCGDAMRA